MAWDPNISLGNVITIGGMLLSAITLFVKQGAALDVVKVEMASMAAQMEKLADSYRAQGVMLIGTDKLITGLSEGWKEKLRAIDEALDYNKTWRHEVAGLFMRETGVRVQELDLNVARLEMKVASLTKEVEVVQITLRSMRGNQ